MIFCERLAKILSNHKGTVLDLGAGDGRYSIFCASFGNKVIALDNQSKESWLWPEYLQSHPNISFIKADLRELPDSILNGKYSLLLLLNVVPFLKKKFFLETLLPKLIELLEDGGVMVLSFFFSDDEIMSQNPLSSYTFDDFLDQKNFLIEYKEEMSHQENHAPIGSHTHHIGYIEIKKRC